MKPSPLAFAPVLLPAVSGLEAATPLEGQRYDFSAQSYQEDDGRIRVDSWYFRGSMEIDSATSFRFQVLHDAITGASPTGALPGTSQPFLADMHDVRRGILGALAHQFGDHKVEFEASRSDESDYLSWGFALSDQWELNQKNTVVSYGVNFLDDEVTVFGLNQPQGKKSYDLFAGVSQILDKNTVVSANLTLGYNHGYLNDPYKVIQRTDIVSLPDGSGGTIDIPVLNIYAENRPEDRFREVLQLQGTHFFPGANGALDTIVRVSNDDYGVFSQTVQLEWRQGIGEKFEVVPFVRYYHQSAADFFHNTLDGVPIANPPNYPDGSSPHYSADYRLSGLETFSLGLKLRYQVCDHFAATASFERYQMTGSGSQQAPAAAYPDADIWTFGGIFQF